MPTTNQKTSNATMNRLRAAVLGANDGIVSTSSVVMGVAGASSDSRALITAGFAALVAGALSMAVGEYVSVSSQRDAERINHQRGHSDNDDFTNPWQAAIASFIAFAVGGFIPFLAIVLAPAELRVLATVLAVILALLATGYLSASIAGASRGRAIMRVISGGLVAMAITYFIGTVFGTVI